MELSSGNGYRPHTEITRREGHSKQQLVDLYIDVDPERDHVRGPLHGAPVTVVEYGDFECPFCGQAEPVVRELLRDFADVRYVWRHLPLSDVHPHAKAAAFAAEAAAEQGAFWEMHDLLLAHQDALRPADLIAYAEQLGLDLERFTTNLREHAAVYRDARVRERKQRHDHVARPWVKEMLQPLVGRRRQPDLRTSRACKLCGRLLAELAESLRGALEARPGSRVCVREQAHR